MTGDARWRLARVTIRDILGFQGTRVFEFVDGLQVIEAGNHTGKSSLALATLWSVTGEIPSLQRIHKTRFRMTNRHAGENAEPEVVTELRRGDHLMTIQRAYRKGKAKLDEDLSVDVGDNSFTGADAQAQILDQLGVKTGSIEGCGVVLQDHRLKLITGKDSDVSEVINDMLGLYNLSRLVPVLDEQAKEATSLQKEVTNYLAAADPLKRWEERDGQLQQELEIIENRAVAAGFDRAALEAPAVTATSELAGAARLLGVEPDEAKTSTDAQVAAMRRALADQRKAGPEARELGAARADHQEITGAFESLTEALERFLEHHERLSEEARTGELDQDELSGEVVKHEARLKQNQKKREELVSESSFLDAAYAHLLSHSDGEICPLCETPVDVGELTARAKSRLSVRNAEEIDRLQQDDVRAREALENANNRMVVLRGLSRDHTAILADLRRLAPAIDGGLDGETLFGDPGSRDRAAERLRKERKRLSDERSSLAERIGQLAKRQTRVEEDRLQPAERLIQRVNDHLVDLERKHQQIETHATKREKASGDRTDLEDVAKEAKAFASRLKKIAKALNEHEQARASAAVRAQLPWIADLFGRIADNPDYDGMDIETRVAREKVTYQIKAISSAVGNLNDSVGHVLSEGDLSAASMALLIGLASGLDHRMGFLMLDDPAQGMDEQLQANFAQALAAIDSNLQLIVLTHQPSFASAMKEIGASHEKLGTWKGGQLGDG